MPTGQYIITRVSAGLTWTQASHLASEMGGELASLSEPEENDLIVNALTTSGNTFFVLNPRIAGEAYGPWIGLVQDPSSPEPGGGWRWLDRSRYSPFGWVGGQPDNFRSDNVAVFGRLGSATGWGDHVDNPTTIGFPAVASAVIELSASQTTLSGTAESDYIIGDSVDNTINGKAGADFLQGMGGSDTFVGSVDDLTGDTIADLSTGEHIVISDKDLSVLNGQSATSTLTLDLSKTVTLSNLPSGSAWAASFALGTGTTLTLQEGETGKVLTGTGGANTLRGGSGDDALDGLGGNDTLMGLDGDDTLDGGTGADMLEGGDGDDNVLARGGDDTIIAGHGGGNDRYFGGAGIDTIKYASALKAVAVSLAKAVARGQETGRDTLHEIENVVGGAGADRIAGNRKVNLLSGGRGEDKIDGDAGNDRLSGGIGDDVLTGGLGKDRLSGGSGADRFDFNSVTETLPGSRRDVVTDFKTGVDKIDLRTIDADQERGGNQAFDWVNDGNLEAGFTGEAGQLRLSGRVLMGDTDGDRKADFQILLSGGAALGDVLL